MIFRIHHLAGRRFI